MLKVVPRVAPFFGVLVEYEKCPWCEGPMVAKEEVFTDPNVGLKAPCLVYVCQGDPECKMSVLTHKEDMKIHREIARQLVEAGHVCKQEDFREEAGRHRYCGVCKMGQRGLFDRENCPDCQ